MEYNIYNKQLISRQVYLDNKYISNNLNKNIEDKIRHEIEGICITEGYIKPNSIKIIKISNGLLKSNLVCFSVIFECSIALPIESQLIKCSVKSVTKVGLKCEVDDNDNVSPFIIFVARDHHYNNTEFNNIKTNDTIVVSVLGIRYELNDTKISIIAEFKEKV